MQLSLLMSGTSRSQIGLFTEELAAKHLANWGFSVHGTQNWRQLSTYNQDWRKMAIAQGYFGRFIVQTECSPCSLFSWPRFQYFFQPLAPFSCRFPFRFSHDIIPPNLHIFTSIDSLKKSWCWCSRRTAQLSKTNGTHAAVLLINGP